MQELILQDSNIGEIFDTTGGVGYNICANLANLGLRPEFITVLGDDFFAEHARKQLPERGISLEHALLVTNSRSASYLYVLDQLGEMQVAVNDMAIMQEITPEFVRGKLSLINSADLLVMDGNLTTETIEFTAQNVKIPIFAETVSTAKALRFQKVLPYLHTITPNRLEAAYLCGETPNSATPIDSTVKSTIEAAEEAAPELLAEQLLAQGVQNVYITLGRAGAYSRNSAGETASAQPTGLEAINVTGAGDSFMAALVYAYTQNLPLAEATQFATLLAEIKTQSADTISPEINPQLAAELLQKVRN
jgi:pseudouridine kinase